MAGLAVALHPRLGFGDTVVPPVPVDRLQGFLKAHCTECHGSEQPEADFDVGRLAASLAQPAALAAKTRQWESLLLLVRRGDMPPAEAAQPSPEGRREFIDGLTAMLVPLSRARQQAEGRTPLRRLNRVEYQNTIRDLLDMPTLDVMELLPEDGKGNEFDNVAAELGMSSVHLIKYQEAAAAVVEAAVPRHPQKRVHVLRSKMTVRPESEPLARVRSGGFGYDFTQNAQGGGLASIGDPGLYRIRVRGFAVDSGGSPVGVGFTRSHSSGNGERIITIRDFAADAPTEIEFNAHLTAGLGRLQANVWVIKPKVRGSSEPGLAVERFELEGPLGPWPPSSYERFFAGVPLEQVGVEKGDNRMPERPVLAPVSAAAEADADRLLRAFLPRAFRRPVADAVVEPYVAGVHRRLAAGDSFRDAMAIAYQTALCSPQFLYFREKPGNLDPHALAARLSYFLWRSMPDDALLAAAAAGRLDDPQGLKEQVERLLQDPKSGRFVEDFVSKWLELENVDMVTFKNRFAGGGPGGARAEDSLWHSACQESIGVFREMLRDNRSVLDFIASDWTYLNEELSLLYGLKAGVAGDMPLVEGQEMRRVSLPPDSHRGGLLTQASVLQVTAHGIATSPVIRGKWLCGKILGVEMPPPPKQIPPLEADPSKPTTIRQRLAMHSTSAACAACHRDLDPPGFALEAFDTLGIWRTNYGGLGNPVVQTDGKLADGRLFSGIDEYKARLLETPDNVVQNVVAKMLVYATGAVVQFADRPEIDRIAAGLAAEKHGLRSLVHAIVQSRMFREK